MSNAQFMSFTEAGTKTGNGFIQVPVFEKEILDMVGKRGTMLSRIKARPATGNPTRYFEKQPADKTAAFQDPHNLQANKYNVKRVDKSAFIKAITNEIEFSHFDREVGAQQGIYKGLTTEDVQDMVTDLLTLQDEKLWTGNDTKLSEATTNEYVGLLTQLTHTSAIADGVKIVDAIRSEIANLSARKDYDVKPSVIVVNPITYDLIEQEEQARPTNYKHYEVTMTAGIKVIGVMTAMGVLPIIADPYLPLDTKTISGSTIHKIAILSENLLTRYYVGSANPRIFAFGIQDESLNEKYMALQYDCIVAKGAEYAHTILTKTVKNA
mgnify:FL=1|jgi:hypothetical protein